MELLSKCCRCKREENKKKKTTKHKNSLSFVADSHRGCDLRLVLARCAVMLTQKRNLTLELMTVVQLVLDVVQWN